MARLIRHTALGPYKIDPSTFPPGKLISICACGLSKTMPICDGTHKTCVNEQPGTLYVYNAERDAVVETRVDEQAGG